MNEILLEMCYKNGKYLGKIIIYPDDLDKLEKSQGSILKNIRKNNSMGYKKYKDKLLEQKDYILIEDDMQ